MASGARSFSEEKCKRTPEEEEYEILVFDCIMTWWVHAWKQDLPDKIHEELQLVGGEMG